MRHSPRQGRLAWEGIRLETWWGMHGNFEAMIGVVGLGEEKRAEVVPKG